MGKNTIQKMRSFINIAMAVLALFTMIYSYISVDKIFGSFFIDDDTWAQMVPVDGIITEVTPLSSDGEDFGMKIGVKYSYQNSGYESTVFRLTPALGVKDGNKIHLKVDPSAPETVWLTKRPAEEIKTFFLIMVIGACLAAAVIKIFKMIFKKT